MKNKNKTRFEGATFCGTNDVSFDMRKNLIIIILLYYTYITWLIGQLVDVIGIENHAVHKVCNCHG